MYFGLVLERAIVALCQDVALVGHRFLRIVKAPEATVLAGRWFRLNLEAEPWCLVLLPPTDSFHPPSGCVWWDTSVSSIPFNFDFFACSHVDVSRHSYFLWSLSSAIITQFTENLSLGYKTVGNLCFHLITHRVIDVSTFQAKISFERVCHVWCSSDHNIYWPFDLLRM